MPIYIKNPETEKLARELAAATGECITDAVTTAIRERLDRVQNGEVERKRVREAMERIAQRAAALPVLDTRTPEEIVGYDEHGLPS